MATAIRITRALILATGILALSVTAAQARPAGSGYTASAAVANPSPSYQGFYAPQAWYKHDAEQTASRPMSAAVDPANAQQVPIVVTQPVAQPVKAATSGFNWTDGMLGAGTATLVLLLAAITAIGIKPERVAQF